MITPSAINPLTLFHSPGVPFFEVQGSSLNIAINAQLSMVYSAGFEKRSSCMWIDELFKSGKMFCLQAEIIRDASVRYFVLAIRLEHQRAESEPVLEQGGF